MLTAVTFGFYSGLPGGFMADKMGKESNLVSYAIAAGINLVAFAILGWTIDSEFGGLEQFMTTLGMLLAGLASCIASIIAVSTCLKNFVLEDVSTSKKFNNPKIFGLVTLAIQITYFKMA
jgi:hypothetical protein